VANSCPARPQALRAAGCRYLLPKVRHRVSIQSASLAQEIGVGFCLFLPYHRNDPRPSSTVPIFSPAAYTESDIEVPAFVRSIFCTAALTVCFRRNPLFSHQALTFLYRPVRL